MNGSKMCLFGGALLGGLVSSAAAKNGLMTHGPGGFNNPGKDYQILWDQSTNTNVGSLADQELLAYGGAYDTYMVDDFSTGGQTWNITSMHTYTSFGDKSITAGKLQFYKKGGSLPDNGADTAPEYKVTISMTDLGGGIWEVAATGLNIPELQGVNGDYWIGLTPELPYGQFGQTFHYVGDVDIRGDLAAWRNPNGGFGLGSNWLPAGPGLIGLNADMSFYLDGDIVPAPGAAALLGLGGLVAARRRRA